MANAFAKAAGKVQAAAPARKKKETQWRVGAGEQERAIAEAISAMIEIAGQRKALETREGLFKGRLKAYAEELYVRDFAAVGVEPERPMNLVNDKGESVTFVVQDRSQGYKVSDETVDALTDLLGPGAVAELLYESVEFGFDAAVMAGPAMDGSGRLVQDVMGEELGKLLERLQLEGVLSEAQVDGLLAAKQVRTYRPGVMQRLPEICGRSVSRISDFLAAVGGACVRYIKS